MHADRRGGARARAALAGLALALALAGCGMSAGSASPSTAQAAGLRYVALGDSYTIGTSVEEAERFPDQLVVALGDSYTIGTSVEEAERFPDQLVVALGSEEPTLRLVANLGINGYTSADLIRDELPALDGLRPEFATVLIGVNDAVQGVPVDTYEANVVTILDELLARLPADRIVTVSVPDYTVTPAGADYGDPTQQHDAIAANNDVMARLARERGIAHVDIFDLSIRAADDRSLVAVDGLHPSGTQYGLWVDRILPVVRRLLGT